MAKRRAKAREKMPFPHGVREALRQQLIAFREKFGRNPEPGDPVFFNPGADLAFALDLDELQRDIVAAMYRARIAHELIYAYLRTGVIVTEDNQKYLSAEDLDAWNRALFEYSRQLRNDPR